MKHTLLIILFFFSAQSMALPLEGLTNLDEKAAELSHQKNTELVVFWATWCPDCREKLQTTLPTLDKTAEVAVITINTDKRLDRARAYVERENIKLPVLRDDGKGLRKSLKVFSVPHWAVYKRKSPSEPWSLIDSAPAFEWSRIEKALGTTPKT